MRVNFKLHIYGLCATTLKTTKAAGLGLVVTALLLLVSACGSLSQDLQPEGEALEVLASQAVVSFTLINADTNQPIPGFVSIPDGATLNLTTLPTKNLNIRANTNPAIVGSVRFALNSNSNYRTESGAPYALASDSGGNYAAWTPAVESYTLKGTPYTRSGAKGTIGTALTIKFTVVDQTLSTSPSTSPSSSTTSLLGKPNFSESQLPAEVLTWYRRMWAFINHPNQNPNFRAEASSGDLHNYAKSLNNHHSSLLAVFRTTGDLRILDEVVRNAQQMRSTLADTDGDGFLNWTYKGTDDSRGMLEEPMAHAHVTAIAYAFHVNRDLISPAGFDYGREADQWLSYLKNHFEPKWRKRNNVPSGHPFIRAVGNHPYTQLMRYHHYMYKLTGDRGYLNQLNHMSTVAGREFKDESTPAGTTLLFSQLFTSDPQNFLSSSDRIGLVPTLYAKYTAMAAIDLHLEGVAPFDRSFMQKLARTLSHFVLDGACTSNCSARSTIRIDIGGGKDQVTDDGTLLKTGYAVARGFNPPSFDNYASWPLAMLAAYDSGSRITTVSQAAFEATEHFGVEQPRRGHIPMAMVFTLLQK